MNRDESKIKRTFTLTPTADNILEQMAIKMGLSKSSVLELAIREKGRQICTTPAAPEREEA